MSAIAQLLLLVTDFDLGSHRWVPSASELGISFAFPAPPNRRRLCSEQFKEDTGVLHVI